jgi:hypothetical protein
VKKLFYSAVLSVLMITLDYLVLQFCYPGFVISVLSIVPWWILASAGYLAGIFFFMTRKPDLENHSFLVVLAVSLILGLIFLGLAHLASLAFTFTIGNYYLLWVTISLIVGIEYYCCHLMTVLYTS